ncbi:MAG TPA: energy transducer TonB [Bryobacteraceae bacterium]|jgi:TonB family protein
MISTRRIIAQILFAIAGIQAAFPQAGAKPPEVVRAVDVVWGPGLEKSYFLESARVGLQLDSGTPVALSSDVGIPDNVVRALAKWKFRGGDFATLTVPVRRSITPALLESFRYTWKPATQDLEDSLKAGSALTPAQASALEEKVSKNALDTFSRASLLAFAAQTGGEQARKLREDQLAWLVPHSPDDDLLGSPLALIDIREDKAGYQRIGEMWITQIKEHPENFPIHQHAIQFLKLADPDTAEKLILRIIAADKDAYAWIGDLYALQTLGVTALDPHTGLPAAALDRLPENTFAQKTKSTLDSTTDARLVLSTMQNLSIQGRALAKAGHLPQGYAGWCERLRARAVALYPETTASCDTSLPLSGAPPPQTQAPADVQVKVDRSVQLARRIKVASPSYPEEARSRGQYGTVRFEAFIGRDGKIKALELLEGAFVFYDSARTAVSKWVYEPTMLDGQPVEVLTDITVNYALDRR